MTKRQQQAIATKNTIYNAAIELMDADGFDNITIADISKKAGVSVGSFYHYFGSKHEILAEIFRKADEYFLEEVEDKLHGTTAADRVIEFFDHYAHFNIITSVDTTKQLFNPKVKFFLDETRPMIALLKTIISRGIETGELDTEGDVDDMVRMLFMFARGIVFDWSLRDGNYDLRKAMREYMARFVATFGCR